MKNIDEKLKLAEEHAKWLQDGSSAEDRSYQIGEAIKDLVTLVKKNIEFTCYDCEHSKKADAYDELMHKYLKLKEYNNVIFSDIAEVVGYEAVTSEDCWSGLPETVASVINDGVSIRNALIEESNLKTEKIRSISNIAADNKDELDHMKDIVIRMVDKFILMA